MALATVRVEHQDATGDLALWRCVEHQAVHDLPAAFFCDRPL